MKVMEITKDIKGKLLEMLYGDLEYTNSHINEDLDIRLSLELESIIDEIATGNITSVDQVDERINRITPGDILYKELLLKGK